MTTALHADPRLYEEWSRNGHAPPRTPGASEFAARGAALGRLVDDKQRAYGDSAGRSGAIMAILYPDGIPTHAYEDALLMVRVLDKLSRIAQRGSDGKDLGGESPWADIAGYGLLGAAMDERR